MSADLLLLAILLILGVVTGALSNVTSGGAGIFTIYFLTNYLGLVIQASTGTVLAASTVIVLVGAVSFYRRGQVDLRLGLTVGISGVIAAFLAARWASTVDSSSLEEAFGAFTLALAIYTGGRFANEALTSRRKELLQQEDAQPLLKQPEGIPGHAEELAAPRLTGTGPAALGVQIAKGALIGVATGLFGVGLASLSVVLFMLLFRLETRMILGTSLFASFFRYLGGAIGYFTTGLVDPFYLLILVVGGAVGSVAGARLILGGGEGSRDPYVKLIVVGILLFVSYEFLLKRLIA